MKAEGVKTVLGKLTQTISDILCHGGWASDLTHLNEVWSKLDQHWREMVAAESACDEETAGISGAALLSGRLDAVEERLKEIERVARPNQPIAIEMQLIPPPWENAGWTWITQLAGLHLHGSQGWPCEYFEHRQDATENGNTWLSVLGRQFGLTLVPAWIGDAPSDASGQETDAG